MDSPLRALPERDRECYPTALRTCARFRERDRRIKSLYQAGWEPNAIAEQVGWLTVTVCVVLGLRPKARWFPPGELF